MAITNDNLQKLIVELKASESNLLNRVAEDLSRPTRIRREVNLSRINNNTKDGEVIIVPGKVLGGGELDHKITISAFKFSGQALEKLGKSGSKIVPLQELAKESVKGKRIRIIG
jgi:large subunit ribosomal protein L18e